MHEVSIQSIEISDDALNRFERKVWLARCQQTREVEGRDIEQRTVLVDDGGFLYLCHHSGWRRGGGVCRMPGSGGRDMQLKPVMYPLER